MDWFLLIVAGLFESGFALCMGKIERGCGYGVDVWGAGFLACVVISMLLLAKAVHTLPVSTAYPVWTVVGAVGTVVLGIVFFHEPVSFARLFLICTLIASVVGLKMV